MNNITYLIGAGASAGASEKDRENVLPIVSNMNEAITMTIDFLKEYLRSSYNAAAFEKLPHPLKIESSQSKLLYIIGELSWLVTEAGSYHSVDTLAKKYYLTKNNDGWHNLERLKRALILYFTIEQFVRKKFDKRYDSFIAAIANRVDDDLCLNSSIKMLSWNYDLQFEISIRKFTNNNINHLKEKYHIYPNNSSILSSHKALFDDQKFCVIKLNGNAIWEKHTRILRDRTTVFDYAESTIKTTEEALGIFLDEFHRFDWTSTDIETGDVATNEHLRYFNFAWEKDKDYDGVYSGYQNNLSEAERVATNTDILVVIGYSFPVFNRDVDNRLISKMTKLKKVYIQDIYPDRIKSTMQNAFSLLQGVHGDLISYMLETNTNQFVIPYEIATSL